MNKLTPLAGVIIVLGVVFLASLFELIIFGLFQVQAAYASIVSYQLVASVMLWCLAVVMEIMIDIRR